MKTYKRLDECENGEWVFAEGGQLFQVTIDRKYNYVSLTDGQISIGLGNDAIVYPLTIENKIISDRIRGYRDKMYARDIVKSGKWLSWLNKKWYELMTLPNDCAKENYYKIYDEIDNKINELTDIRNKIKELETNF